MAVALCVGIVLGSAGVRAWYEDQRARETRIRVSLYPTNQSADPTYVNLRLRNRGERAVTIDRIRLDLTGFDVTWGGLEQARTVRPGDAADVSYELAVDCAREPGEVAEASLRVRTAGTRPRWLETEAPLTPNDVPTSLRGTHTSVCRGTGIAPLVDLQTLDVRGSSNGGLALRVRASSRAPERGSSPSVTRLRSLEPAAPRSLDPAAPMLRVSFDPLGDDESAALPAEGLLRVRVTRCGSPRASPQWLFVFRAELTSSRGSGVSAPATADLEYARALLDYLEDRC